MPWDPARYEQFARERYQPFEDVLRLIDPRPGLRVIDLGCGTGELTQRLAGALPESDVVGIDSSREMLDRAAPLARPGLRFELQRIEEVVAGGAGEWDVVFSHAALQWVDGHESLVPRLYGLLRPGGQIAVQMPYNFAHATHTLMWELAASAPYREALAGWSRSWPVLPAESYAELLFREGAEEITAFEKVYPHVLEDADALVDWMRGTALVPVLERLPEEQRQTFLEAYRDLLRERFPERPVFFGFRRLIFAARRM